MDCIFCKIVAGEIPAMKVYEDENFLAFLDIMPVAHGHTLVIPKEHHPMMTDTPDALVAEAFVLIKKIIMAVKQATGARLVATSVIGDEVPHFHIHLIPRHQGDGLSTWPRGQYAEGEGQVIADKIKNAL